MLLGGFREMMFVGFRKREEMDIPSCSGNYGILADKSSHANTVDGVDFAAAITRALARNVRHLEYRCDCCLEKSV